VLCSVSSHETEVNVKRIRPILIVVFALLTTVGILALGSTMDKVLDALWGKDMTVEEFIRATEPGLLAGMSERMRHTKVTWSPRNAPSRIEGGTTHYVGTDAAAQP
jgi:hypothetical protein